MTPTKKMPLFIITGASCAGKSTTCEILFQKEQDYLVMESDLLWEERYNTPEDNYCEFRRLWMRICANISQIGKPAVLCGCAVPEQFEQQPERELFSEIFYLAVVCEEERRSADRGAGYYGSETGRCRGRGGTMDSGTDLKGGERCRHGAEFGQSWKMIIWLRL